jgi:hypothetical protein
MSRFPCSLCSARIMGKPASLYWAWFLADDTRNAWKQRLCIECFSQTFLPILQTINSDSMDAFTCPACGGSSETDLDAVYLNLFLPKQEMREFELNTDAACAAKIRGNIVDHGERLPNRGVEVRGPSSLPQDPWADLEL